MRQSSLSAISCIFFILASICSPEVFASISACLIVSASFIFTRGSLSRIIPSRSFLASSKAARPDSPANSTIARLERKSGPLSKRFDRRSIAAIRLRAVSFTSLNIGPDASSAFRPIWQSRRIASPREAMRFSNRQSSIAFSSSSDIMIGTRWSLSSSTGFFGLAIRAFIHE